MAIRRVAQLGNPVVRQKAAAVDLQDLHTREFQTLIDDLIDTMRDYDGVGIAAPQVHVPVRVFAIEVRPDSRRYREVEPFDLVVAINPQVAFSTDEKQIGWEGCLSVEGLRGLVTRHHQVNLRAYDRSGEVFSVELVGFPATIAQHESDHLDGLVYLDRMDGLKSLAFLREFERHHLREDPVSPRHVPELNRMRNDP